MATSNIVTNLQAGVGAGADVTVQPPAGEEWLITDFSNNPAFVGAAPDVQVSLTDGVTPCICLMDPTTDPGKRTRQFKFYLTHDLYMLITNTGAAGSNVGFMGEKVTPGLTRSGIITIAALGTEVVRPPVGETWEIVEWGADTWTAGPADINPDVQVGLTDGALVASRFTLETMVRGQDKQPSIIIDHDVYLNVYSTGGCNFVYVARRIPVIRRSLVQDMGAGLTLDLRPAAGDEWLITELGAETWAGAGAPNNYPDVLASVMVGANLSDYLEPGAGVSLRWNSEMKVPVDNTHWLRATNNAGGNNEIAFSAFLKRSY